jgi:penicillin-binding protein 2
MAMAGKSGSAQVRRITMRERDTGVKKNDELPWKERDHALFIAFAPVSNPRWACCVTVEHGGGGSGVAAPICRDILIEVQKHDPQRTASLEEEVRKTFGDEFIDHICGRDHDHSDGTCSG